MVMGFLMIRLLCLVRGKDGGDVFFSCQMQVDAHCKRRRRWGIDCIERDPIPLPSIARSLVDAGVD